jgi:hypothetical protein
MCERVLQEKAGDEKVREKWILGTGISNLLEMMDRNGCVVVIVTWYLCPGPIASSPTPRRGVGVVGGREGGMYWSPVIYCIWSAHYSEIHT